MTFYFYEKRVHWRLINMARERKISLRISAVVECWASFQFQSVTQRFVSLPEWILSTYHCVCHRKWGRAGKGESVQSSEMLDRSQMLLYTSSFWLALTRSIFYFSDMDLCHTLGLLLFFFRPPQICAVLMKGEQNKTKISTFVLVYTKTDLE